MHKVLIVDDHPIIRFAVDTLLSQGDYQVNQAKDGIEGASMARELKPDVVILDLGLPKLDGLSVLMRLRQVDDPPRIIVFTGMSSRLYARRCIEAGASAFVLKDEDLSTLGAALKAVLSGYSFLPDATHFSDKSDTELKRLGKLSNREFEVMRLIAKGSSNNEIAEAMTLSAKTISTYKTRIMEKLSIGTLVELIDLAKRNEMI